MSEKITETFYDETLCKDIRILIEMIASLSNSYRLLVGGAEELSRIALVHKHDAEEAIDRADELGDIIDDIEGELRKLMRLYLEELMSKIEMQKLYNGKLAGFHGTKLIQKEIVEDLENKYERNNCDNK